MAQAPRCREDYSLSWPLVSVDFDILTNLRGVPFIWLVTILTHIILYSISTISGCCSSRIHLAPSPLEHFFLLFDHRYDIIIRFSFNFQHRADFRY
jgi:hypothetical protein